MPGTFAYIRVSDNCKMAFQIFRKKITTKEVTTNPNVLYDLDNSAKDILVHNLKLGDSSSLIPIENVSTTTFEQNPNGITRFTWKDNKVYYDTANGLHEYTLTDRIKSVLKYGGILHMTTGAKYVIRENSIIGIGIHDDILNPFKHIKRRSIQKKFGKADKILDEYEEVDGTLFHSESIYHERQFRIGYDEWAKEVMYINLGKLTSIDNNYR